jgi:hypothetical protein
MQNIHMLDIYGIEPKLIVKQLIELHRVDGLNEEQASKAALTTFHVMLSAGLKASLTEQSIQKARNYLIKNIKNTCNF